MSVTTRVRGLAPWSPYSKTRDLLDGIRSVLIEYRVHLPLTIRQVFYRLVGVYSFPKDEHAYRRLSETLNRARRAGIISWGALRDDGIRWEDHAGWTGPDHLVQTFLREAEHFTLDRQHGQPRRLMFAVEAEGMVPQIARIARPYGIDVHSTGGFDSVTAKYALAQHLGRYDATEVLHIGDHDPSGIHLFTSMAEDVQAIARDLDLNRDIKFSRLVVTPEQITLYSLPTAPPKPTDQRSFDGDTTQAEALPPDILAKIVQAAITDRVDMNVYHGVLAAEQKTRSQLSQHLKPLLLRDFGDGL